jgi:hypothetical protein
MQDYGNLRWDDAYTKQDRTGVAKAAVEALSRLMSSPEALDLAVPLVIANRSSIFGDMGDYTHNLTLRSNGLYIDSELWHWQKRFPFFVPYGGRVELTSELVEEWKISAKDVLKAAEKIGATI